MHANAQCNNRQQCGCYLLLLLLHCYLYQNYQFILYIYFGKEDRYTTIVPSM
jgi:hypothetical protein